MVFIKGLFLWGIHTNAVNLLHHGVATDEMVFAYEAMKVLSALNLVVWVELPHLFWVLGSQQGHGKK